MQGRELLDMMKFHLVFIKSLFKVNNKLAVQISI